MLVTEYEPDPLEKILLEKSEKKRRRTEDGTDTKKSGDKIKTTASKKTESESEEKDECVESSEDCSSGSEGQIQQHFLLIYFLFCFLEDLDYWLAYFLLLYIVLPNFCNPADFLIH